MPLPATAHLPRPKSEDEFEDMVLDALRIRWKDPDANRNGRRGQRQCGVDICGRPENLGGRFAGAQCKNVPTASLNMMIQIEAEVTEAEEFKQPLAKFYFVVAANRDAPLQQAVRDISSAREKEGMFPIELLFWDDICGLLAQDDSLVTKYWPTQRRKAGSVVLRDADVGGGDGGTGAAGGAAEISGGTGYSGASGGDVVVEGGAIRGGNAGTGGAGGAAVIKGGDAK
jgi:hypothetical protein